MGFLTLTLSPHLDTLHRALVLLLGSACLLSKLLSRLPFCMDREDLLSPVRTAVLSKPKVLIERRLPLSLQPPAPFLWF